MTEYNTLPKGFLSGSSLKIIAVITMLIDHTAAVIMGRMLLLNGFEENFYNCYLTLRQIGRIAFPIFIFLMIEGFEKTGNRRKYVLRMAVFALCSEIPFDLAFSAKFLEFSYQNVFFTLVIGMVTLWALERTAAIQTDILLRYFLAGLSIAGGMAVAELMNTDYGAKGIIAIVVMYLFRRSRWEQIIAGSVAFVWEAAAIFAFLPIAFYNGKRGLRLKYIFYIFYPLHLLILYFICLALGIQDCAVV